MARTTAPIKRWAKRLSIGVVAVLLSAFGIRWFAEYRAKRAWLDYKSQREAEGASFTIEDYLPDPVPPEENFAEAPIMKEDPDALRALDPFSDESLRWVLSVGGYPERYPGPESGLAFSFQLEPGRNVPGMRAEDLPRTADEAVERLRQHFLRHEALFDTLVEETNTRPTFQPLLDSGAYRRYDPVPYNAFRKAVLGLRAKGLAHLHRNEPDQAATALRTSIKLTAYILDQPSLFSRVVAMTLSANELPVLWEGLRTHQWTEPQLDQIEHLLEEIDFLGDFQHLLGFDQAVNVAVHHHMMPGHLAVPTKSPRLFRLVPELCFYRSLLAHCQYVEPLLQPKGPLSAAHVDALEEEIASFGNRTFLGLFPMEDFFFENSLHGFVQITVKILKSQVSVELSRLGIALERHRLATGNYPDSLEALAPRWLDSVPRDRITGEPLIYRLKPDGTPLLYSVGMNRRDDGGVSDRDVKQGDWVWQYTPRA